MRILFAMLLLPFIGQSQVGLGKDREKITKIYTESFPQANVTLSDTAISITLNPGSQEETLRTYYFTKSDEASVFRYQTPCISCFENDLADLLGKPDYGWKKINGNQYVSRFEKKLLLETDPSGKKGVFRVIQTDWTKKSYRLLLGE